MNEGMFLVVCILCFIVGFIFNEVLRDKYESSSKIPFKEEE